jgi:uncharacterized Fe-S cluster-containing protein
MNSQETLPGLNCGMCGHRTCDEFAVRLKDEPGLLKRCIPLSKESMHAAREKAPNPAAPEPASVSCPQKCGECGGHESGVDVSSLTWQDSLGREFDFYLEHFPEDPGPREVILPRNPIITRELEITPGEIILGRPLGMSCGCPITHCGKVMKVDTFTGVIIWCVTGPLEPRKHGSRDIGYYSAEAYEGIIKDTRCDIKIGMRYFFQPRMCMLQWRHSGLVNYINKIPGGLQVRLEGLWIG